MATGIKKITLKSGNVKFQIRPYTGKTTTLADGTVRYEQILERYSGWKEAERRLREIKGHVEKKSFTPRKQVPFTSDACDSFIENKKKTAMKNGGKRSASTIRFYENITENHIKPVLGPYRLNEIDKKIAESARDTWSETAPIFVNKILMAMRSICEENGEAIPKNPFKQIGNVPRTDGRKAEEIAEVNPEEVYGSWAEVDILLSNAITDSDRLMIRLAAEAGLRDGEILGLPMEYVLPEKEIIQLRYQWRDLKDDRKDGKPILQKLKNRQSIRDLKISTGLAAELAKWKRDHAKNPYISTYDGKRVQLMFISSVKGPCSRQTLKRAMDRAVDNAHEHGSKLKRLAFYSLRHFCASFLIQNGLRRRLISDLEIASRMGHKDSTITRKVYARFLNAESTFDPNKLWSKPVIVEQPTAGQQPELLQ